MHRFRKSLRAAWWWPFFCALAPAVGSDISSDQWPREWTEVYERFERYLATRHQYWPRSGLQVGEDGTITHAVPTVETRTEHLSVDFFEHGRQCLGMAITDRLLVNRRERMFDRGVYAACVKSSGALGYQHHFPIVWFEVRNQQKDEASHGQETKLHSIPPSADGEKVWPNERLLAWLDFHVFDSHRNPNDIRKGNELAHPSVLLRVDEHGAIEREILPDERAEKSLCWLIYHDGSLKETGSAAGAARRESTLGTGNYIVFAGVKGPAGFMPVSNELEFPLFPDEDGKPVCKPRDTDRDGIPDFVERIIAAQKAPATAAPDGDMDNDGLSDHEETGGQPVVATHSTSEADRHLLKLWEVWRYELRRVGIESSRIGPTD